MTYESKTFRHVVVHLGFESCHYRPCGTGHGPGPGNSNLNRTLQEDIDITPSGSTSKADEAAVTPQVPDGGGTYLIGTCYSSPLVIPAAAFSSDGFLPDSSYFTFGGGGGISGEFTT